MASHRALPGRPATYLLVLALAVANAASIGARCGGGVALPASGSQLFMSPQANPVALSGDGALVYVANTTSGTLSIVRATPPYGVVAELKVGHDPVGVAVRPKFDPQDPDEDELVFVANHLSDSISVVSRSRQAVVQTIQELDGSGVSTTDEPVGIAFDGPGRAFATLDHPNQVIALEPDAGGEWSIVERATLTAQAPRALAVREGRLYVAAFESGNQTEFPSCGASDPAVFHRDDPVDEGCLFPLNIATLLQFAQSPNLGGEVVFDSDIPDRDLFVYDTGDLSAPLDVVEGVGTLLYGVAATGSGVGTRVFVTNTDARNKLDGLRALGNRMFENRLSWVGCSNGACTSYTAPVHVDLDAAAAPDATFPTPYGIAASDDGAILVATAAGSDGSAGFPTLFVLDPSGAVQGSLELGAIAQGVALRSDPETGAAETAFVLNTVDDTLSVVDLAGAPAEVARVAVGSDPTPAAIRRGRILFSSARASSSGTFSCESCHPNGNIDQLLWTINSVDGPADLPGCNPVSEECPEPRTTMPVRGLRDTLPLHWDGSLGDPVAGAFVPGDSAPDCDIDAVGEVGCIRHLVEASLAGVMCEQEPCPVGPSGQAGPLDAAERDDMAAFLDAVSYPPSPARRPTEALSATARTGVRDFFTDRGGFGANPATCADAGNGCHALPLGVATNSRLVGRFDAPTMRGIWDRHILFSNAVLTSSEFQASQGFDPSPTGPSEARSLAATFPGLFTQAYGVPVTGIQAFLDEMSVGLPALAGRQVQLGPSSAGDPAAGDALAAIEAAAGEGRITATAARGRVIYKWKQGLWTSASGAKLTTQDLRDLAELAGEDVTVTADLPAQVQTGGARQPLLFPAGADLPDGAPNIPIVSPQNPSFSAAQRYTAPSALLLLDGAVCTGCTLAVNAATIDATLSPLPATGTHVVQVLNPNGFSSNELPVCRGSCQ